MDKTQFILDQLAQYPGKKKVINSVSTFITCPQHTERTPSFRVYHSASTRSPGFGSCYGCGYKAPWDTWAASAGMKPYAVTKPIESFSRKFLSDKDTGETPEVLKFARLPRDKVWREISTSLLRDVGGKFCYTDYGAKFIFLPVNILGEQRGYLKARLKKEKDKPSYINKKGGWSRNYGLFLFDYALRKSPNTVVLVEGPRDALRLNAAGIPAISILGTQSWSEKKATLLDIGGVETAILAMDGDDAGKEAIALIKPILSKLMAVKTFKLTGRDSPYWQFRKEEKPSKAAKEQGVELWDPGNMPTTKLRELKALWKSLNTNSK